MLPLGGTGGLGCRLLLLASVVLLRGGADLASAQADQAEQELCVLVDLEQSDSSAMRAMQRTWAHNNTFFVDSRRLVPWQPLLLTLEVPPGLNLWRTWASRLPDSCQWVMKVPSTAFVNLASISQRLHCLLSEPSLQYLGVPQVLSMGLDEGSVPVADPAAGIVLHRKLLARVPAILDNCAANPDTAEVLALDDHVSLGACLWYAGVELHSWLDQADELILDQKTQGAMFPHPSVVEDPRSSYLRLMHHVAGEKLSQLQCMLIISGLEPGEFDQVQAMFAKSRRWFKNMACVPGGIMMPELTGIVISVHGKNRRKPVFSPVVRKAISEGFLSRAFEALEQGRSGGQSLQDAVSSPAALAQEWLDPQLGQGPAVERLGRGGHEVCIFVLSTVATEQHVADAAAVMRSWANPGSERPTGVEVFMMATGQVSQAPLDQEAMALMNLMNLGLRGDVDLGFLFNPTRAFYLWRYLAVHHADHCKWFVKVDADTFVNTWALKERLQRYFESSDPLYLGPGKNVILGSGRQLKFALNSIVLSQALLKKAKDWLRVCMDDTVKRKLGKGAEDVDLAYCFDLHDKLHLGQLGQTLEMPSRTMAKVRGGGGGAQLLHASGACTMLIHPVHAAEMHEVYDELRRRRENTSDLRSCDWPNETAGNATLWQEYMDSSFTGGRHPNCWDREFNWNLCCRKTLWGSGGNVNCWDEEHTFARCCDANDVEQKAEPTAPSDQDPTDHTGQPLEANALKAEADARSEETGLPTLLPLVAPPPAGQPVSAGNPKCWAQGGFTYDLCCRTPGPASESCWVWPYSRLFCCEAPLPPRPPLKVGGLPSSPRAPPPQQQQQQRPSELNHNNNNHNDNHNNNNHNNNNTSKRPSLRRPRTHRCPEPEEELLAKAGPSSGASLQFTACEKSLDEIGALFELSVIGGGDKASGWHDYLGTYERLLFHLPLSANVLELGVRMGSSLAMWSEYFPLGKIVGVDKSTSTFLQMGRPYLEKHGAFTRNNVQVVQANASDISALGVLASEGIGPGFADVVVDDANHWAKDQIARFELYFPTILKAGGVYIIEDVHIQAPYAHDGTAVRNYFANISASAYLTDTEILVGAHQIQAVRRASQDWRHQVESVTFMRDVVAISKAEASY